VDARYINYKLKFKFPAGTSKGVLHEKQSYFVVLNHEGKTGIGECSLIPGISPDRLSDYESTLQHAIDQLKSGNTIHFDSFRDYPSICFGIETALLDLKTGGQRTLFDSPFLRGEQGIPINGLVWMGDRAFMEEQLTKKIDAGFKCIKLKIGAINFDTECEIISGIRKIFSPETLTIRLDANGAFAPDTALEMLKRISEYNIHSIEQPIQKGQWEEMSRICEQSPVKIALDEELGTPDVSGDKRKLLEAVKPHYIILKPSILGGFSNSMEWIREAEALNIGWWVTSALESNIGLNAIAQWTASLNTQMPQGLGTGQIYHNNIPSPLEISGEKLIYNNKSSWELGQLL
jgi:o-succinylbenzoate synthase